MLHNKLLVSMIVAMVLVASVGYATTWDLATDFGWLSNPNGQWTYGFLNSSTGWHTYGTVVHPNPAPGGSDNTGWNNGDWDSEGNIQKNFGPNDIDAWASFRPAGLCDIGSPCDTGSGAGAKWTCAAGGNYLVTVWFTGQSFNLQPGGTTTDVRVLQGSSVLASAAINGYVGGGGHAVTGTIQRMDYSGTLTLAQGDVLYFLAGSMGGAGDHLADLGVTITSVPEPSSLLAFVTGFAGLAGFAVRRRRH